MSRRRYSARSGCVRIASGLFEMNGGSSLPGRNTSESRGVSPLGSLVFIPGRDYSMGNISALIPVSPMPFPLSSPPSGVIGAAIPLILDLMFFVVEIGPIGF